MEFYKELITIFNEIEKQFSQSDLLVFISEDYNNLYDYHFGLGTWIRNNILNDNKKIMSYFYSIDISDKDFISNLFIKTIFYSYKIKNQLYTFLTKLKG